MFQFTHGALAILCKEKEDADNTILELDGRQSISLYLHSTVIFNGMHCVQHYLDIQKDKDEN